ncbi:hypothetical protein M569_02591 [Genlisea aurea]|uniref:Uncharacterized protein n=1 Tax=Genlisea aurea TaxID=192259 RepID=S8EHI5_9LAMI|nr:hypothetical protein M569_02591 [Genlisea aurea]
MKNFPGTRGTRKKSKEHRNITFLLGGRRNNITWWRRNDWASRSGRPAKDWARMVGRCEGLGER